MKTFVTAFFLSLIHSISFGQVFSESPVWSDEFNIEGEPDSTFWSFDIGGKGWGNNELQYYT